MVPRVWVIRGLLVAVVAAPLSLLVLSPVPGRPRETDLRRVYDRLPERCLFTYLDRWCGLRVSDATPEEAAQLRAAVEAAPDPRAMWCGPLAERQRAAAPGTYQLPKNIQWYRLSRTGDRGRWIGVGVLEQYNTGWTAYWIWCRVAVGFEP